jgi:hypothetical protein
VPAINELLAPFGVAFGDAVLRGDLSVGGSAVQLASAAQIVRFPVGGWLVRAASLQDEGAKIAGVLPFMRVRRNVPILGLLQPRAPGAGRLVTFGDSECVDSLAAQQGSAPCWWLLQALLTFACDGRRDPALFPDHLRLLQSLGDSEPLPARAPTLSSAHGDTRSAAADDAKREERAYLHSAALRIPAGCMHLSDDGAPIEVVCTPTIGSKFTSAAFASTWARWFSEAADHQGASLGRTWFESTPVASEMSLGARL